MSAHVSADEQNAGFNSLPPPSGTNCWICLEDDGRLLRNCACRGDSSGYAHVSCLAEHARTVSDKAEEVEVVHKAWVICPNCKQSYQGDMSLAMAEAFVEYASHLPNNSFSDIVRFDAELTLGIKLEEIGKMGDARVAFEHLLDSRKPSDATNKVAMAQEAHLLERLAISYAKERGLATDSSKISDCIGNAISYYEKANHIYVEVYGEESYQALHSQRMLAQISGDTGAYVKTSRALCGVAKKKYGSESLHALKSAAALADALQRDNKLQEASDLLEETIVKARRVLGPDHPLTLKMVQFREKIAGVAGAKNISPRVAIVATIFGVNNRLDLDGEEVEVLALAKEGKYIVCRKQRRNGNSEEHKSSKFKAKKTNLIFASGTKVTVIDLAKAQHLNGQTGHILSYKKDVQRYAVAVGEDFRGLIKPENLEVLFP